MDNLKFDRLARSVGRTSSRRRFVAALSGFAGAVFVRSRPASALPNGQFCGGIAGFPCPDGYTCVDIASDGCDPENGGADCGGVCVPNQAAEPDDYNPCAAILCSEGSQCCPQCGGQCVSPETDCASLTCGQACGSATCAADEYCCNSSCGYCRKEGVGCTRELCGKPKLCGAVTCRSDQYCCNESCSICAPRGAVCTMQICDEPPAGEVCGSVICPVGEVCCNASCGVCTPPDGMCTMIACD